MDTFLISWRCLAVILLKGSLLLSDYNLSKGSLTCFLSTWPLFKLNIIPSPQTNSFSPHSSALSLIHHVCHFQHSKFPRFFFRLFVFLSSVQFSSVAQSCPTLCDPMNHSTPGLPVHHQIPEFTQTHVHQVGDAIRPSHPLLSPSPPAPSPPSIPIFKNSSFVLLPFLCLVSSHLSFRSLLRSYPHPTG